MTLFLSRICFLGFVGLFVAVSFNALHLQGGGKPQFVDVNRKISTAAIPNTKKAPSRKAVSESVASPSVVEPSKASRTLVQAVQRELTTLKYYTGGRDGIAGIMTSAAIMAYEYDRGMPLTGEATETLLRQLLLGPSQVDKRDGPRRGNSLRAIHTTKAVQQVLATLGYSPGVVDGMAGRETRKAIRSFEKDRGLKPTGRISGLLVRELKRVTGEDLTV